MKNSTNSDEGIELSDSDLLRMLGEGERSAATEIYHRYADRLLKLASRQSGPLIANAFGAEDIVQSVFRTFFRRANEGFYQLPEGDELWKLFLVISLYKIRKKAVYLRADKRNFQMTKQLDNHEAVSHRDAELTPKILLELTIDELVSTLPVEHRGVIRDRVAGFQVDEIAKRNQLSRRTTERVLQSFKESLTKVMEAKSSDE